MKNIKKASCNNQSIKRFLSPQHSNIPCKRQCKQMGMENKCNTQKGRDICIFSGNPTKQHDEMEKRENNLQLVAGKEQDLNTNNNAVNKFDWNSFVRDPGVLQESRYPVTLNTFKSMTHSMSIVNCILEDIKIATSLDFINDELMKERVLKNFFIQFYENPQIRNIYKLETKPCPTFLKKKIMQIPTLEIIEVKDSDTNAATVATANTAHVEAINNSAKLRVPVKQSLKTLSKPTELERVEAQSSKSQENEIPTQQTNEKSNILYLSKNMLLMDESFLRRHVGRNTQQIEKLDIILERIYAELLPRKQLAQTKEVKSKPTKVHEISNEVCIDISNSPEEASAAIAKGQRIEQAKQLFLTEYTKKNTLAYALRFHNGLKRRIISAILEMSIDEFKKYTKIHDVPEMYDDPKLLRDCYNYAIKAPQIWPVNLYMELCDIFEYLEIKGVSGVSVDNLEDISPMLLHWTELAVITNFDEIVQWDFYRCKGEKFQQFTQLDVYRKRFYEKCWMHNTWLREVPKLHVEMPKRLTRGKEVVENDNVSEVAAVNVATTNVNLANATEQSQIHNTTKDESTNAMNVDCAEQSVEAETNNTSSVPTNVAKAAHAPAASAGHLAETNEAILSHNPNAASSVEPAITVKEKQNSLLEATLNVQTTKAVVEIITNSKENAATSNLEAEAQQRIQAAQKLYFYEVEKSYTLPYLLRLHNGLKRRILHAILNMTYTEFKQYTHIYEAAEIYENNELLQHCYDFVVRKPQVWPVNLYMRLADLYKFLKIKGLTLSAADLKHVSPKLLHWHDLIATTNYDYLLFWDYYRRSGKKMAKNTTRLNSYRQKFYEKCWLYDSWIWHTPKICDNVLTDDFVAVAAAEDKENANFEIAVMTHALEERDEETTETEEPNRKMTEGEEINGARIEPSPVRAIANENVEPHKNSTGSVSTVDAGIQTSEHLLHAACANASTVSRETAVPAENPNPVMLLCKAIKKEKLSPLDKLQFNLTNDEENYECVPVLDDIVDLEGSISANETQEELLLPLSNSESLGTHDNNLLLSLDSIEGEVAEHTAQCTENMETESILAQQPSLELNNEQTQLMSECIVEMEIAVQTTTTAQQPIAGPVLESNVRPLEQPQIETQTKPHSAPQTGETCSLQEQQQQEAHIVVQQALTGEQVHVPGFISREVKEELLQEVQQSADNCTEHHRQKQKTTKQLKSTGTEVATALTRIIEAHKLALQQKQQNCSKNNAQTTVESEAKQQQEQTLEKCAVREKQQHSQRLQKHSQSQQQSLQKQKLQQPPQHQQLKTATEHQQEQKQQQQAFTVKIPLPKAQQQRKKQQQQISALKQAKEKQPAAIVQQSIQQQQQQQQTVSETPQTVQQQKTVTKAPRIIQQQQHDASTTIAESNNTQKKLKSTPLPQKQEASNEQRAIRQQTPLQQQQQQQQPLPTVVIPMSMLQQHKEFAVEDQAPQTQKQQIRKSLRTQKSQIIAKQKVPHTKKQLESQQLAKPSQALHTKTHVQQELQEQENLDIEKQKEELHQHHQLVPQNVAKAVAAQIQPEPQQSPQQLTQTELPTLLVQQQQAINNQNENEPTENPQPIEPIKQSRTVQQQTIGENLNASNPTGLEFLPQQLQQQFNQPQLILQRTSTQIQEQVMLRSTGTPLSQDSPINLPPFVQLTNKQTINTTKKKSVKPTKPTTRKAAKLSDYVPQLTHVFQPLPVALNTKKAPTLEPTTTTTDLPESNTNVATASHQQLTPAVEEQFVTASNISLSPPTANAMVLTLPVTLNATSTSASNASNASFVYTLSGDSSLFNSSELLKALENYQLQFSQQQQQQQQMTQSEQTLQQQLTQSEQSLQQQVQQEQPFELNYNRLQVTQQQQQDYQVAIQMSQPLAFVDSAKQQEEQEQQQQEDVQQQQLQQQLLLQQQDEEIQQQEDEQQQQQQEKQLQQQLQQQLLLQQQPQSQQLLLLQQLLKQQQQHNQAAIQIQQPLLFLDHVEQQQQLQQQQSYQLLLHQQQQQQQQQHQQMQPIVYQLVDVNQAPHTAAAFAGEQVQQYLQLSQTPYFTQLAVQEESATQAQQSTTLDTANATAHLPPAIINEMLQANVWFEHNYAMAPLSHALHLTSLPSPKGVCRMRSRPLPKSFFYRRLEKIDYFRELTALNIAEYRLQCTSLGKSYLQAQIRTTHLRTVVSGDILAALLPRCAPDLLQHLQLVLQYLGEFHFNTWEQRQQRKVISKCSQRTLHTLCAHILLLFFQYSSPFQSKCLDMATGWWQFEQRNCLGVETARASSAGIVNMFEDLSLAIDPCVLAEMAALKRNL